MKSTGVVRKVDELGRIVVPKELRRVRAIDDGTPLEIFVEEDQIILQVYQPGNRCLITEEISVNNLQVGNVILSKHGAKEVYEELKKLGF